MSVNYTIVARGMPGDPQSPKKYYSLAKSTGAVSLRQLAEQIAARSTVSTIDTMAVLEGLVTVLPQNIADGKTIKLGDLGYFRLSLHSNGSDTAEEVTVQNIKSNHLLFRPGKEVKKVLDTIDYKKTA